MRIGAHESIAGGLHTAFERAAEDGAEALQIFTKSGRQWAAKALTDEDVRLFRAAHRHSGLPVIAHGSYLVNLGAPAGEVREKSTAAFRDEIVRCETLGIPWLVVHPGAHPDEEQGLELISRAVREALAATSGAAAGVLFEVTAGQGNCIGYTFAHLARLLDAVGTPERMGVCLDTCHLLAAGYDLTTDDGYGATMAELDRRIGASRVRAFHLNDAKKGLGSRVDRHEHIGDGALGIEAFRRVLADERFTGIPAVLETPEGRWKEEIALLQALRDGRTAAKRPASKGSGKRPSPPRPRVDAVAKGRKSSHSKTVAAKSATRARR